LRCAGVEQQVVHRPELSLSGRHFRGERGMQGMRMDFLERKVPVDQAHAPAKPLQQQPDAGAACLPVGALEVG